jgi:hypothetical protein
MKTYVPLHSGPVYPKKQHILSNLIGDSSKRHSLSPPRQCMWYGQNLGRSHRQAVPTPNPKIRKIVQAEVTHAKPLSDLIMVFYSERLSTSQLHWRQVRRIEDYRVMHEMFREPRHWFSTSAITQRTRRQFESPSEGSAFIALCSKHGRSRIGRRSSMSILSAI